MQKIIELKDITKHYKDKLILDKASLEVHANEIVALVGKNGSGKSTLLKILVGLIKPDYGKVYKHKSLKVGYVPEVTPTTIPFTPVEYLTHMGKIRGMAKAPLQERIDYLLDIFQLHEARNTRIANFSKGMKKKVTLMQAMLEDIDLLILDEPLSGLDPKAQSDLEDMLLTLKDRGLSVVLTCHETKLLDTLVDRVLFIQDYQLVKASFSHDNKILENRLIFEIPTQQLIEELLPLLKIQEESCLDSGGLEVEVTLHSDNTQKILLELLKRGASIKELVPIHRAKEEFYNQFEEKGERK